MTYRGIRLSNEVPETDVGKLGRNGITTYINNLKVSVDEYFPQVVLDKADPNWTKNQERLTALQELDHRYWKRLGFNEANFIEAAKLLTRKNTVPRTLVTNFKNLRTAILTDKEFFCQYETSNVGPFWKMVMDKFTIDATLKEMIQVGLVTPLGSASAERTFRYYQF